MPDQTSDPSPGSSRSAQDLDALKSLLAAATPLPWESLTTPMGRVEISSVTKPGVSEDDDSWHKVGELRCCHLHPNARDADAALIVAAVNGLPALLAELERQRPTPADAEQLARAFHEAYERLAPDFGYQTREASAKPWEQVPDNNRALMTAVCAEVGGAMLAELEQLRGEVHVLRESESLDLVKADRRVADVRQSAINGFAEIRTALLAALGIEDDRRTTLVEYVGKLTRERDSLARRCSVRFGEAEELRAQVEALTAERDRAHSLIGCLYAAGVEQWEGHAAAADAYRRFQAEAGPAAAGGARCPLAGTRHAHGTVLYEPDSPCAAGVQPAGETQPPCAEEHGCTAERKPVRIERHTRSCRVAEYAKGTPCDHRPDQTCGLCAPDDEANAVKALREAGVLACGPGEIREDQDGGEVVAAWNAAHPVGTVVRYWRGVREGEPSGTGPTRSQAELLSGHTPVVWIEGCSGCIALTHVEVVADV